MSDFILQYYNWLSGVFNSVAPSIRGLADTINLPLVSVLLFGLMGTLAPCQLSTNVAALAFLSRDASDSRRLWGQIAAFISGKVTVYLLVGGLMVVLSLQMNQVSETVIPVVVVARRAQLGIGDVASALGDPQAEPPQKRQAVEPRQQREAPVGQLQRDAAAHQPGDPPRRRRRRQMQAEQRPERHADHEQRAVGGQLGGAVADRGRPIAPADPTELPYRGAVARQTDKGTDAARVAVEMANLLDELS